jgi:hypothetical protein
MKIKTEIFNYFLKCIAIGKTNNKVILNFTEEGLRVDVRNEANVVGVRAFLSKDKFEKYKPIGEVGITNLSKLRLILFNYFKEEVELIFKKDNKNKDYYEIIIQGDNKYTHTLAILNLLDKFDLSKIYNIPFEEEINIEDNKFDKILPSTSTLEAERLILNVKDDKFISLVESPFCNLQLEVPTELKNKVKGNYSILLGKYFFEIIKVLKGDVKVRLHSDDGVPLVLFNDNEFGSYIYAVAKRSIE